MQTAAAYIMVTDSAQHGTAYGSGFYNTDASWEDRLSLFPLITALCLALCSDSSVQGYGSRCYYTYGHVTGVH